MYVCVHKCYAVHMYKFISIMLTRIVLGAIPGVSMCTVRCMSEVGPITRAEN